MSFYWTKTSEGSTVSIIDDLNYDGDSLGIRRLKAHAAGAKLFPLKQAIYHLGDLLRLAEPKQWFIDSKGKEFTYVKTKFVPLIWKRITNKTTVSPFEATITVEEHPNVFISLYTDKEAKYAGLLEIEPHIHILYGCSKIKLKNTRRKI